jgi:hypothetical protein
VLLGHVRDDVEAGGPSWSILERYAGLPFAAAVPLRFLGAVHRLVLAGRAPTLARHYPSVGGDADADGAWEVLRALLTSEAPALAPYLARPPQTNEVARAAALVGGFLTLVREHALPLRLLEIGASAGLHLRFDRYRYEAGGLAFGDAASPVRFVEAWEGTPPLDTPCAIVLLREGCDANPVDPTTEEGRLTLTSYVWPDQAARLVALRGALAVAARVPALVDRAPAAAWVAARLPGPMPGAVTVVFHSIVWQYLAPEDRQRIRATIEQAGRAASAAAPVAWLRFEPSADGTCCEVRLRSWPDGGDRLLATSGFHGPPVRWLA